MSYYLYWGKAKPASEGDSCHLLPYHSLDVAAVGWHLLAPERPLTQLLAASLGMPPESLRRFFVFLLGLHDFGKFSRTFQGCSGQVVADTFIKLLPRFSRSPSACGSQGSSGAGSCCTPSRYRSRRRASLTGGSNTAVPPAIRSSESRRSAP